MPLTLTTQMSAARLWQLRALCMSFPGPVSVVLYVSIQASRLLEQPGEAVWVLRVSPHLPVRFSAI